MRYRDGRLLVFARAPVPGSVKTRLMPALAPEACARLQAALTRRVLTTATQAALCPLELWCAPDCTHRFFRDCERHFPVRLRVQRGGDLGERMQHALATALEDAAFAVVIGSDCPAIDPDYLLQACAFLSEGVPLVVGPALDGGYVLIGVRRCERSLFEGIAWGTGEVMAQTRQRVRRLGWAWRELTPLGDIDTPADLRRLDDALARASGVCVASL